MKKESIGGVVYTGNFPRSPLPPPTFSADAPSVVAWLRRIRQGVGLTLIMSFAISAWYGINILLHDSSAWQFQYQKSWIWQYVYVPFSGIIVFITQWLQTSPEPQADRWERPLRRTVRVFAALSLGEMICNLFKDSLFPVHSDSSLANGISLIPSLVFVGIAFFENWYLARFTYRLGDRTLAMNYSFLKWTGVIWGGSDASRWDCWNNYEIKRDYWLCSCHTGRSQRPHDSCHAIHFRVGGLFHVA